MYLDGSVFLDDISLKDPLDVVHVLSDEFDCVLQAGGGGGKFEVVQTVGHVSLHHLDIGLDLRELVQGVLVTGCRHSCVV